MTPSKKAAKRVARDRINRVKVSLGDDERAEIQRRAELTGLSVSGYLRAAGLGHPIRSDYDFQAVQELAKVAGDQGRLGGLLKLWLTDKRGQGAAVADVNQLLKETRELQSRLLKIMGRL